MENIIRRKMQEKTPTCYGRYPKKYNITDIVNVKEDLDINEDMSYRYDITLKLGKSVICTKDDLIYMKEYTIRDIINELYGEIYQKLLKLRTNIYYGDSPENIKILNELLEYARP